MPGNAATWPARRVDVPGPAGPEERIPMENDSDRKRPFAARAAALRRVLLSDYVLNGVSATFGFFLVAACTHLAFGETVAVNASVGAIIALLPDNVRPTRGHFGYLIAAPLLGLPLFLVVQLLRPYPIELGLFLVPATFVAFLATAWGRRGMPIAAAAMFAMLLAMAPLPATSIHEALLRTVGCALGAFLYVLYATASGRILNRRYRAQAMADLLFSIAALMRTHALRLTAGVTDPDGTELKRQAALADQMQQARDLILERPNTRRRQRLAGMLMVALEMRDHVIVGELGLGHAESSPADVLQRFGALLQAMADDVARVADSLLLGRKPAPAQDHGPALEALRIRAQSGIDPEATEQATRNQAALIRSATTRFSDQNRDACQLAALARGDTEPDLSAVRTSWHLFVSPTYWSLQPLLRLWHWRQPVMRHALRAALAIGAGYAIALFIPWGSRDYWVLITIVVVLRGNLAQTLERRNLRVLGTLVGSLLAALLLASQPPVVLLLVVVIVAQGVAHAFVARRYLVTAMAGSVLGLVLANLLHASGHPAFDFADRVGDTLLGAAIAWAFSYVLPSWERDQMIGRVQRVCKAAARHAERSLALAALDEITAQPELAWRLARREAYDALSALVQAIGRAPVEPRAVQPPLDDLKQLQAHGFQLLGQLSAIQSLLLLRRERLDLAVIEGPTAGAALQISRTLDLSQPAETAPATAEAADETAHLSAIPEDLPDPLVPDSSPWLLRRLALAVQLAGALRSDAERVLAQLRTPRDEPQPPSQPTGRDATPLVPQP
jgi:uncharacterized membrane protein YccC